MKKNAIRLPEFKVLASPYMCSNGKLNWGIGETTDFSMLHHINEDFDGLNRETDGNHKNRVHKSIMKHGDSLSVKVCIYKGKAYRVDGNNRGESMDDGSGSPIRFSFRFVETLDELIQIMIDHNDKAKNWGTTQYVRTHATNGSKAYKVIMDVVKAQRLNVTIATAVVGNVSLTLAKKYIRSGKMEMDSRKFAMERANAVKVFLTKYDEYPNMEQRICEGLLTFVGSIGWNEFFIIKNNLAKEAKELTRNGYMVGKTKASDFEDLFKKALSRI